MSDARSTDRRRANLRPWAKGQSGNPRGRPKVPEDLKKQAQAFTKQALGVLAEVMADKAAPPSSRVRAAAEILDRGWGRPESALQLQASANGGSLLEQLALAAQALRTRRAPALPAPSGPVIDAEPDPPDEPTKLN